MEKTQDNIVRGDIVYNFLKDYNTDIRVYNKYHKDNVEELDWNETIATLNAMSDEQKAKYEAAFKEAQKQYVKICEKLIYPILEEVLGLESFKDMWIQ